MTQPIIIALIDDTACSVGVADENPSAIVVVLPGLQDKQPVHAWLQYNTVEDLIKIVRLRVAVYPTVVITKVKDKATCVLTVQKDGGSEANFTDTVDMDKLKSRNTFAKNLQDRLGIGSAEAEKILALAREQESICRRTPRTTHQDESFREDTWNNCILWNNDGKEVKLTNFIAKITKNVLVTDGVTSTMHFDVRVTDIVKTQSSMVKAAEFDSMKWLPELGSYLRIIPTAPNIKNVVADAIRAISGYPETELRYSHTGWVVKDGKNAFLTASGAMTADGLDPSTSTFADEADTIAYFALVNPPTGNDLVAAIRQSLNLLSLSQDHSKIWPMIGTLYLTPVAIADYSLYSAGQTGSFKTETARVMMSHLGQKWCTGSLPTFKNTPASGASQARLQFRAKDVTLLIDDCRKPSSKAAADKAMAVAEQVFQSAADHSGRDKCNPDGSMPPKKPSRCTLMSNGETGVPGHSTVARMLIIPLTIGDIDADALTKCQNSAREGVYNATFSAYVQWLSGNLDAMREMVKKMKLDLRGLFTKTGDHRRSADNLAQCMTGIWLFLSFAKQTGAIDEQIYNSMYADAVASLNRLADVHREEVAEANPVKQFIDGLQALLLAGRAHVTTRDGEMPLGATQLGWRLRSCGLGNAASFEDMVPQGDTIGIINTAGDLCLMPDVVMSLLQRYAVDGEHLAISTRQIVKQLHSEGKTVGEGKRPDKNVKADVWGQKRVIVVRSEVLGTPKQKGRVGEVID